MTLYICAHCTETFGDQETAKYHEYFCGIVGGETREIPGISLVNGKISGGEN